MKFVDSNGKTTDVDTSGALQVVKVATDNNKLTDDASTEGIIYMLDKLDSKIIELKGKLNSLKGQLVSLKSAAAALSGAHCEHEIVGDCSLVNNCNTDDLVSSYGSIHVSAIESEIQCIETNLEVLEYTRALYAFMKPNNMKFY